MLPEIHDMPNTPKDVDLPAVITSRTSISVPAQSDGTVMSLPAHTDGYVHKGDPLLQLDVAELRSKLAEAESSKARAQGEAGRAGAQYAAAARKQHLAAMLARTGAGSMEEVRAARSEQSAIGGDSAGASAQIKAAEIQIAEVKRLIDLANVKSPMDGTIAAVKVHMGDMAHKGQQLVRVFDPNDPIIKFSLPHAKASLLKAGDVVQMTVGESSVNAIITNFTDDHDTAIDFLVVTAELDRNAPRASNIKVGATGHVRIADKGAVR
jgi:multidrug resistance efflux pump